MHHAGDILGSILCIYGGLNTESRQLIDDIILFDISNYSWVTPLIKYNQSDKKIGARA